jgi:hypothetical protein
MTQEIRAQEAQDADDGEVCPHCGGVLDLARAIESDRSVLHSRTKALPNALPIGQPEDPSVV